MHRREIIEDARSVFIADRLAVLASNMRYEEVTLWSNIVQDIGKPSQPKITPEMIKQHWKNKKGR